MQQLVSELSRPVVLSDRALRALAGVKDAHREHVRLHGGEPTLRELAAERGLSRDQVQSLMVAERKPRALEEPVGGEDEVSSTFGELLSDERAQDAYDDVPLRFGLDELPHLLGELTDRESAVVCARYGLDGPERTLRELGSGLGVSAERVR